MWEGYPNEKILDRHFLFVVKLTSGDQSFPLAPSFLAQWIKSIYHSNHKLTHTVTRTHVFDS